MENNIKRTKLSNGLEIVTVDFPNFHSITSMLAIRSGSRYEDSSNNGVAHFLEHMAFKGTQNFDSPKKVSEAIEGVGGYLNAWTSVDHTVYWNTVPANHYDIGLQMPVELAYRPLLRQTDLDKERGVIIEEIRQINDYPAQLVGEIAHQATYAGSKLGNSVIGTEKNITNMTLEQFKNYHDTLYNPAQSCFVVAGKIGDIDIVGKIEELLGRVPNTPEIAYEPFLNKTSSNVIVKNKKTDQGRFILSVSTPKLATSNKERFTIWVLDAILGSGMSSRLFATIREQKGLAYNVGSSISSYQEVGDFSVRAGVNVDKINEALLAVVEELELIKSELVSDTELTKAKNILLGEFDIDSDKPVDIAVWYGINRLLGANQTREEARDLISQVSASDVQKIAQELFTKEKLILSVVGPYDSNAEFKKILE